MTTDITHTQHAADTPPICPLSVEAIRGVWGAGGWSGQQERVTGKQPLIVFVSTALNHPPHGNPHHGTRGASQAVVISWTVHRRRKGIVTAAPIVQFLS